MKTNLTQPSPAHIEQSTTAIQKGLVERLAERNPELGAAFEPLHGGVMCFAGHGSYSSRARGLWFEEGTEEAVFEDAVLELMAFYAQHGTQAQIEVMDTTPIGFHKALIAKGFTYDGDPTHVHTLALNDFTPLEEIKLPEGYVIRALPKEDAMLEKAARSAMKGFGNDNRTKADDEVKLLFAKNWIGLDFANPYVVDYKGDFVAAGCLFKVGELGLMMGGNTWPEHRGKGLQTALANTRLALARDLGCTHAVVSTGAAGPSKRNALRLGFQLQYTCLNYQHS